MNILILTVHEFNIAMTIAVIPQLAEKFEPQQGIPRLEVKEKLTHGTNLQDPVTEAEFDAIIDTLIENGEIRIDEHEKIRMPISA